MDGGDVASACQAQERETCAAQSRHDLGSRAAAIRARILTTGHIVDIVQVILNRPVATHQHYAELSIIERPCPSSALSAGGPQNFTQPRKSRLFQA